jgi:DNA-binding Lrp family transcriptional regulator
VSAVNLTETDLRLVDALRADGRASFEALAVEVGVSRKVVRARLARLFEDGVVHVVATVAPSYDDVHAIAHLSVSVAGARHHDVARAVAERPEAVFVSVVSGEANVVAEVRARDTARLTAIVDEIRSAPGVRRVETVLYDEILEQPHLPPAPSGDGNANANANTNGNGNGNAELDETDHVLIARLRADGRASYSELAGEVGLSPAATRARVLGLIAAGTIRIVALVNPTRLGRSAMAGFALEVDGPAGPVLEEVRRLEAVDFLARTLGGPAAVGTIVTTDDEDMVRVLDALAAVPGVARLRSWTHLRLVQERYAAQHPEDAGEAPVTPVSRRGRPG